MAAVIASQKNPLAVDTMNAAAVAQLPTPSTPTHRAQESASVDAKTPAEEPPIIIGKYRLDKTIGQGTYGKVKLGTHVDTGDKVAVKVIEKAQIKSPKQVARLQREIRFLKLLYHPHIVKVHDVMETSDSIFIIMEYAVGGELFDYIVANKRVKEKEARAFFRQVLSAVDYCHQNSIIHRDLKPENLLLDANKCIKIIDFGFGNTFNRDGSLLDTFCGSPFYAAPEMILGRAYRGPEVDMWSLGVILFALLCGHLPFDDDNMKELYKKIAAGTYKSPDYLMPDARHLISRLITVDPAKRATLDEVLRHRWVMDGYPSPPPSYVPDRPQLSPRDLDSDIVGRLAHFGYEKDQIEQAFEQAAKAGQGNAVSSTYFLLHEMLKREERKAREAENRKAILRRHNQEKQRRILALRTAGAAEAAAGGEERRPESPTQLPSPVTPAAFGDFAIPTPPTPTSPDDIRRPSSSHGAQGYRHPSFSVAPQSQSQYSSRAAMYDDAPHPSHRPPAGSRAVTQPAQVLGAARGAQYASEPTFPPPRDRERPTTPAYGQEQVERAESQHIFSAGAGSGSGSNAHANHPIRPHSAFGVSSASTSTMVDPGSTGPEPSVSVSADAPRTGRSPDASTSTSTATSTSPQRRRATVSPTKTPLTLASIPDWFVSVSATSYLPLPDLLREVARVLQAAGVRYVATVARETTDKTGKSGSASASASAQAQGVEAVFECEVDDAARVGITGGGKADTVMDVDGLPSPVSPSSPSDHGSALSQTAATGGAGASSPPHLCFRISVVRLAKQPGQLGLHFKRMHGGVWTYKRVCGKLVGSMRI